MRNPNGREITPEIRAAMQIQQEAAQRQMMDNMRRGHIQAIGAQVNGSILSGILARNEVGVSIDEMRQSAAEEAVLVMQQWGFDVGFRPPDDEQAGPQADPS